MLADSKMKALWKDLLVAIRQFRHQPGFAFTVIGTLALAIGANIAVFSVVNAILFRALPFIDPERLVWIASVRFDNPSAPFTIAEFMDYRSQTHALSGISAFANWSAMLAGDEITEGLQGARISANAFDVLGVTAVAGRLLHETDDRPDAPKVVVLSYRLWQRRFSGAADVIDKTVRLNGESFMIAGVLPSHFPFPLRDVDVYIPLVPDRDPNRYVRNSANSLRLFGRLNSGASNAQAQAELKAICRSLRDQFPKEYARKYAVRTVDLREALIGDYRQSMLLLLGAVLVVLGTALANLVSLVLVRANERRAELSIRSALGASPFHLLRQLMMESLLLAVVGCGLGWILAALAVSLALPWAPSSIPRLAEVSIDRTVLGFAALMAMAAATILTAAPLGAVLRTEASDALRSSRGTIGDRWGRRVRRALLIAEISTALLLLLTTTVLLQDIRRLKDAQLGFKPDPVLQARVSIPASYASSEDVVRFYDRLSEQLVNSPGVVSVGVISVGPLSGILRTVPFTVESEAQHERDRPNVNLRVISPGYFHTIGTRLVSGRPFSDADRLDTPPVAVVSAALAKGFLNSAPLNRRLLINDNNSGPRPIQIVGVVEDVRQMALDVPPGLDVYIPMRQIHPDAVAAFRNNQFWMTRTATAPSAFGSSFRAHLRAVDSDAAISSVGPMREYIEAGFGPRRFNLGIFVAFSLAGVLLAVVGMYGLVSYAVSQRTAEIGLRMAIGATEQDIRKMILGEAAFLGIVGVVLGGSLAAFAHPLISHLAQDVSIPFLPAIEIAWFLLASVTLAALLPARRAARTAPTLAMRQ
jgi:putative ABC transport system permease protein